MAIAQAQQVKEKYDVQCLLNNSWKTQMSFDLDERYKAMDQAKSLSLRNPQVPVRVVLDGYNYTTKHHTQAVIYKSANYLNVVRAKKQVIKVRLGLWGYVGVAVNTLLMCILGGLAIMSVAHLGLSTMYATVDAATYKLMLMSVFAIVFFGILYFSVGYIRARYVYVPHATGSVFFWKKKAIPLPDPSQVKSALDARVHNDMSNAARAISYMPVNDHHRKKQSPYEAMSPDEVRALFQEQEQEVEAPVQPVQPVADTNHLLFLKDFSREAQGYLAGAKMKLKGRNLWGYSLFLMGALKAYAGLYRLDDKTFEICQSGLLGTVGWKGARLEQFLFDYEAVEDDDLEGSLIEHGSTTMKRVLSGHDRAIRDVAYFIQQWKAAVNEREAARVKPFILACELKAPLIDQDDQAGPAWPVAWSQFLNPQVPHIFDIQDETLVLDFANEEDVFASVDMIRTALAEQDDIQARFSLCDSEEDEVIGTRALEILADVPEGGLYLSEKAWQMLGEHQAYTYKKLDEMDPPVWSCEGMADRKEKASENQGKSGVLGSLPDFS